MMSPETLKSKRFRLYSIAVELRGHGADRLAQDFDFFTDRPDGSPDTRFSVTLELVARDPQAGDLPGKEASRVFSDCVLYQDKDQLIYEYSETVFRVTRSKNASYGQLISKRAELAQEIGYLYLQSEIGRFLDLQGLHRVHALGLGLPNGRSALVLLPSGGGKSTLAVEALKSGKVRLLSDDTPLIDRWGNLHPFPLRLSFREDAKIPDPWREQASLFTRRKYGNKILVPVSALPPQSLPRPGEHFPPGFLVIARRHGQKADPELSRLPRLQAAKALMRDLVFGLGIPQVAELVLTQGLRSLPGLAPTAASRMAAASAFLARAQPCQLDLSRDSERNALFLLERLGEAR